MSGDRLSLNPKGANFARGDVVCPRQVNHLGKAHAVLLGWGTVEGLNERCKRPGALSVFSVCQVGSVLYQVLKKEGASPKPWLFSRGQKQGYCTQALVVFLQRLLSPWQAGRVPAVCSGALTSPCWGLFARTSEEVSRRAQSKVRARELGIKCLGIWEVTDEPRGVRSLNITCESVDWQEIQSIKKFKYHCSDQGFQGIQHTWRRAPWGPRQSWLCDPGWC